MRLPVVRSYKLVYKPHYITKLEDVISQSSCWEMVTPGPKINRTQEFFVIDAEHYKARPDLVNTGRTLFGKLPTRHQQGDLNYFQPIPTSVATLLDRVQALMLEAKQTTKTWG